MIVELFLRNSGTYGTISVSCNVRLFHIILLLIQTVLPLFFFLLFINFYMLYSTYGKCYFNFIIQRCFSQLAMVLFYLFFHSNEKIICLCLWFHSKWMCSISGFSTLFHPALGKPLDIFHKNVTSTLIILSMLYLFLMEKQSKTTCRERAQWHWYCLKQKSLRMARRLWKGWTLNAPLPHSNKQTLNIRTRADDPSECLYGKRQHINSCWWSWSFVPLSLLCLHVHVSQIKPPTRQIKCFLIAFKKNKLCVFFGIDAKTWKKWSGP